MSSLAMFAATIDDNSNITLPADNENIIQQKRQHKKTQRKYSKFEGFSPKVNSVLQQIHNTTDDEEDVGGQFTFNPPPKTESMGVAKTDRNPNPFAGLLGKEPVPDDKTIAKLDVNGYASNYSDQKSAEEYYKQVLPGYNTQGYKGPTQEYGSQDVLLQKLNYMINLLEEQQDEKTNNVTEEVILYSFLGIFIIFMADTFVRVGKYTR
ncbi:MAG: hypothetical protein ACOVRN_10340 [Flavobacterium sp.]